MPTAKFLAFLFENQDTDIFQKDIEEFFSLRPSTVSRSLKLLEEKGYIIRTSMDYDSRLKKITLAEKSKEVCRSFEMSMRAVFEEVTKNISEQDIDNFNLTLSKMIANLDK